ncbi:hypothetical protein VCV18_012304 [Metarhizium anisopliae]
MDDALPPVLDAFVRRHLTLEEIDEIRHQFSRALVTDRQVLWTGMTREAAQRWADKHNMQTLTTAMGPLMSHNEVSASGTKLRSRSTRYIHGASAIFAWCISYGKMVTVLSNPPPVRFHPSGATSFQVIEEPIITGRVGSHAVARIDVVHPAISAAAEFRYEFWPRDDVSRWITTFGHLKITVKWRPVKRAQLYLNDGAKYIDKSTESLTARPLLQKQFAQNNASTGDMKLHELQQKQLNLNNEVTEKRERLHRKHVNEVARLQSDFRNARNGLPKKAKKRQELHECDLKLKKGQQDCIFEKNGEQRMLNFVVAARLANKPIQAT